MSTWKQRRASRRNAQLSTGPRSEEGKRISSQNALKSGLDAASQILPGESTEAFAQLQNEYHDRFRPATPEARFQVDNLVRNEWLIRRFHRVESQLWHYHAAQAAPDAGHALGAAWAKADAQFMRLQRRITAAEKAYQAAKAELDRLQPQQTTAETEQMGSFLQTPASEASQVIPHPQSPSPTPVFPLTHSANYGHTMSEVDTLCP